MSDQTEIPKKLKAYIINHLRRIGYRAIHRSAAFERAHRGRAQWECENCKQIFKSSKDLHGDHIDPVIEPERGFTTWDDYINRLFLGEIQAICVDCHRNKTERENNVRREERKWEEID